ncbi:MAG: hypothetical protein A4S09_10630 [Proteobacteria bacterium SG_bin7]|nr:MAG: hypothetical protein A4S09_10630 [Proteobacteria bacterium SG_bin7]
MFSIFFGLVVLIANFSNAQEGSNPTLILSTGTTQSLEDQESVSRRYTVKPSTPRPKSREPKDIKENKKEVNVEPLSQVAPATNTDIAQDEEKEDLQSSNPGLVEVRIAPGIFYSDSKSNYWFRQYSSASPSISINAAIWLSHSFGLQCSYLSSLGAEISGSPSNVSHIPVSHQWFTFGLQAREYNPNQTSAQFVYGLKYSDYQFQAPLDSQFRSRLKTSGVGIYLKMVGEKNRGHSNIFEVEIYPQTKHKEVQTSITLNSGEKVETNSVTLGFGQTYSVYQRNHFFWNLRASFEKNNFSGSANVADPKTSQTPTGVTVTNQTYLLEFGYQWGH